MILERGATAIETDVATTKHQPKPSCDSAMNLLEVRTDLCAHSAVDVRTRMHLGFVSGGSTTTQECKKDSDFGARLRVHLQ